jgi:hypothetical protein
MGGLEDDVVAIGGLAAGKNTPKQTIFPALNRNRRSRLGGGVGVYGEGTQIQIQFLSVLEGNAMGWL